VALEKGPRKRQKQWYSVTVETLRGIAVTLLLAALGTGGFFAYRAWQRQAHEREAAGLIEDARELLQRLQNEPRASEFDKEAATAFESFEQAQAEFAQSDFTAARDSARRATSLLLSIFESLSLQGTVGEAQFIAVQGLVEVRRESRQVWDEARVNMPLRSGDFVRTSGSGSAEVVFHDGTLYTVRPNTQFVVSRVQPTGGRPRERAINMEYGWVDLATSTSSAGKVTTPGAEARIEEDSEAFVTYERETGRGRFGTFRGGMELSSEGGARRRVGELQQVVATGTRLSEPRPLPGEPEPLGPADELEIELGKVERLELSWKPVAGAKSYSLQVSRNRLFSDNVIEDPDRTKTSATLGVRGSGSFQWRVAAVDGDGARGPWSETRRFRVASLPNDASEGADTTPPELELDAVQTYGTMFIVGGRSEPGSQVTVNDEPVIMDADGTFTTTVQLANEGLTWIRVKARDASGNETMRRASVYVETP
jgi:hypothetical protein